MRLRLLLALTVLMISFPVFGESASKENLQGKWKIVKFGNDRVIDADDAWEFRGADWIAWSEGKALTPDPYTVDDDIIDLGYGKITVIEKSGDVMKTEYMGAVFTLEKMKKNDLPQRAIDRNQ